MRGSYLVSPFAHLTGRRHFSCAGRRSLKDEIMYAAGELRVASTRSPLARAENQIDGLFHALLVERDGHATLGVT